VSIYADNIRELSGESGGTRTHDLRGHNPAL
jgi:hypothetical protein